MGIVNPRVVEVGEAVDELSLPLMGIVNMETIPQDMLKLADLITPHGDCKLTRSCLSRTFSVHSLPLMGIVNVIGRPPVSLPTTSHYPSWGL